MIEFDAELLTTVGAAILALFGGLFALWIKRPKGKAKHVEAPIRNTATADAAVEVIRENAVAEGKHIRAARDGKTPGKSLASAVNDMYPDDDQ